MKIDRFEFTLAILIILLFICVEFLHDYKTYDVPSNTAQYIVKSGDTLWEIATENCPNSHTGSVVMQIEDINNLTGFIVPGQVLTIPVEEACKPMKE